MNVTYNYSVEGRDANETPWMVSGQIIALRPGEFPLIVNDVLRRSFQALTKGQAQYGKPGVGCVGPYSITKLTIEEEPRKTPPL